jgi:hypothetical protein
MSANWKAVKEDLDWSLNSEENVQGRDDLKAAFRKDSSKHMDAVLQAYKHGQRDNHKISNLSRCAHEDDKRLYNIGRKLIGLKAL